MMADRTICAGVGIASACAKAHSAKAHIIGWRVIANTPRGAACAAKAAPGAGSAGLPISDPMNRMLANSTISEASAHSGSSTTHSGGSGGMPQIGRASCREKVCQYGWIAVVAVHVKKKHTQANIQTHILLHHN